ncbi:PLC-like phosphodiesterase [Baffinella frigidus]|nr:PLC-like phosphodiesterase [Cryptophyta sp. CCMP2293]
MPHGDIRAQRSGGAGGVGGAGHVSHAVNEEWSKLVSLSAVRFKGFGHKYQGFEMSSFAEGKAVKLAQKQRSAFVQHNRRFLARIYPYGGRVDSSNMDPVPVWGAGCQMVALNFQTNDVALKLNHARFLENGNCGYVLKPPYQRGTGPKAAPVVSCQRLPNNFSKDVCGPYVTLTLRAR